MVSTGSLLASAFAALAFGYLCGSIPFGVILTRLRARRPAHHRSGNIGATNVLRTGRKMLAAATLLGDMLKGTAAVLIVLALFDRNLALVAGFGAFIGHLFPVWLRFKGGKGVATYIGILLGLAWPIALGFCAVWLAVAAISRYSSLAALVAGLATPPALWAAGLNHDALLFVVLTMALWIKHRDNIARLAQGTEGKIGQTSQPAADA
jgi:glycerol-3-phosphate acyltransferase PlsY